jgi:hypothetical protein
MKRKSWIFTGFLLLMLILVSPGCKNSEESVRKYERMEKKMLKEEQKSLEAAKKNHLKIQSKATRQMMKDSKKRAKKLNKPKKR